MSLYLMSLRSLSCSFVHIRSYIEPLLYSIRWVWLLP